MSSVHPKNASRRAFGKVLTEAIGLARTPQRAFSLVQKLISDRFRTTLEHRHLYSYIKAKRDSDEILDSVIRWILNAQRPDGGIAAYYSLLTGFSEAYPEVTGYVVPTLYDYDEVRKNSSAVAVAERATNWLLSLQLPTGAFPGGLYGSTAHPSVFNTGQILQGLVRAHIETRGPEIKRAAIAAGDWLVQLQQRDGSWSGRGAYQDTAHTYYTMVAWALVDLSERTSDRQYAVAANKNLDWTLDHFRPNGWIDGIHLHGHPNYLHFIAYILQGTLELPFACAEPTPLNASQNQPGPCCASSKPTNFYPEPMTPISRRPTISPASPATPRWPASGFVCMRSAVIFVISTPLSR